MSFSRCNLVFWAGILMTLLLRSIPTQTDMAAQGAIILISLAMLAIDERFDRLESRLAPPPADDGRE